jgi:hypothetical protein
MMALMIFGAIIWLASGLESGGNGMKYSLISGLCMIAYEACNRNARVACEGAG